MDPSPSLRSHGVRRKLTVMVTVQYRTEHFQSAKITLDVSPAGGLCCKEQGLMTSLEMLLIVSLLGLAFCIFGVYVQKKS